MKVNLKHGSVTPFWVMINHLFRLRRRLQVDQRLRKKQLPEARNIFAPGLPPGA